MPLVRASCSPVQVEAIRVRINWCLRELAVPWLRFPTLPTIASNQVLRNAILEQIGGHNASARGVQSRHYVATGVSVELPRLRIDFGEKPASVFSVSVDLGRFRLVLKGTLDLLIGVRIPASQSKHIKRVSNGGQVPPFSFLVSVGNFVGG